MGLLEEKLIRHPFFSLAQEVKKKGIYPYFRAIEGKPVSYTHLTLPTKA